MNHKSYQALSILMPISAIVCAVLAPRIMHLNTTETKGLAIYWLMMCVLGILFFVISFTSSRDAKKSIALIVVSSFFSLIGVMFGAFSLLAYLNKL